MTVFIKEKKVSSNKEVTYVDITEEVKKVIEESKIQNGLCTVLTSHTTCSVFLEEDMHDKDENGFDFLQNDLNRILESVIPHHDSKEKYKYPGEEHYKAVESWENAKDYLPDGDKTALWNADAHIKSTLLGNSESFAVENNKLSVGKTGYIYFADFDRTRERIRKYKIVIIGE